MPMDNKPSDSRQIGPQAANPSGENSVEANATVGIRTEALYELDRAINGSSASKKGKKLPPLEAESFTKLNFERKRYTASRESSSAERRRKRTPSPKSADTTDLMKRLLKEQEEAVRALQLSEAESPRPPAKRDSINSTMLPSNELSSNLIPTGEEDMAAAVGLPEYNSDRMRKFLASQQRAFAAFDKADDKPSGPAVTSTARQESADLFNQQPSNPKRYATCQCCFEDIRDTKYACSTSRHYFCPDCTTNYIKAFAYGETYPLRGDPDNPSFQVLPCIASECESGYFSHATVENATTLTAWEAYQEKMFHISAVADDALERQASDIVDPNHALEEALTATKLRRCPSCKTPFLKEAGYCNKIKCPACRTTVCYICRQVVPTKGYDHFCVHAYDVCPHECGKCVLWTTQDDQVDSAAMEAVKNSRERS